RLESSEAESSRRFLHTRALSELPPPLSSPSRRSLRPLQLRRDAIALHRLRSRRERPDLRARARDELADARKIVDGPLVLATEAHRCRRSAFAGADEAT